MGKPSKRRGTFVDEKSGKLKTHGENGVCIYWSKRMLDDLVKMYPCGNNEELADFFGVSVRTLYRKVKELGLRKDREYLLREKHASSRLAVAASRKYGNSSWFKVGSHHGQEFKKGHEMTPEQREFIRKSQKRAWDMNTIRKVEYSIRMKKLWSDSEWREQRLEAIKNAKQRKNENNE